MTTITANDPGPARFHPRVPANFMVKLFSDGKALVTKAIDLSMAGVRLFGVSPSTDRITISIPIPGDREVVTKATVKRRESGSVAVQFDQLDWDDMFALARFLHPRMR
jgi:hypothetical protein